MTTNLTRFRMQLAYNGRNYCGWQRQPNAPSVQETIEQSIAKIYGNTPYASMGCGRTDAGVHAKDFVLHIDLPSDTDPELITLKLNRMLPEDIVIHETKASSSDFHARFDATSRTYRYFIHQKKDPFAYQNSLFVRNALDFEAMNVAAKHLLGTKDFTSLSKLHTDVKTNICDVTKAEWVQTDEHHAYFEITANRFLRNMVRATVGVLLDIGHGKTGVNDIPSILQKMDRQAASTSVLAQGLFLWEINY